MTVGDATAVNGTAKPRTIDVPLEKLPPIDEHAIEIDAPAEVDLGGALPDPRALLQRALRRALLRSASAPSSRSPTATSITPAGCSRASP